MKHHLTLEQRFKCMQGNKKKDTSIEIKLRKALWHKNIRFRKNNKKVLGTPDISIIKYRLAIFCDGDFWHGKNFTDDEFKVHKKFWDNKIKRNKERDLETTIALRDQGWTVLRFWESDINNDLDGCVDNVIEEIQIYKHIRGAL